MEPLTIAVITAGTTVLVTKFTEEAWGIGKKWIKNYFEDHLEQAQEKGEENALQFLNELARRVQLLENEAKEDQEVKQRIESALQDPDFSALLKDTMIASSRSTSEEKHKIFARIVSERLRAESEGLLALVSTLACDAVSHLTPNQLNFLAIASVVYHVRPITFPPEINPAEFNDWYIDWLTEGLSPLLPVEPPLHAVDYVHLEAVSCMTTTSVIMRDLCATLSPPKESGYEWACDNFIDKNALGIQLKDLWKSKINHITLTSVGRLIGVYVRDEISGSTTTIDWDPDE